MNTIAAIFAAVCLMGVCRAQERCDETQQGRKTPHPTDCSLYMMCDNGFQRVMTCGQGTVFNPTQGYCDFRNNVPSCLTYQNMCDPNPCSAGQFCEESNSAEWGFVCRKVTTTNACSSNPCPATHRCVNTMALPEAYQCLPRRAPAA